MLIDARGASPCPLDAAAAARRAANYVELRRREPKQAPPNSFGLGHMCNHPPRGIAPNVVALACNLPSEQFSAIRDAAIPAELLAHVPNVYDAAPSILNGTYSPSVVMQSVVLMTTRKVSDEELLLDYRLSPGVERPNWYSPADPEEESRRWLAPVQ